jgi:hypothetical protein
VIYLCFLNIHEYIQPLPAEETKELFVQFGNDIGVIFAPAVLDDIYQTTNG